MSLQDLAATRQSDRKYDESRPVPREVIERILEVARLAPSATNSQPWTLSWLMTLQLVLRWQRRSRLLWCQE